MRVMRGEELQAALHEHEIWLSGSGGARLDLRGADLRWADLRWADLSGADLSGADLHEADLRWANLREANLLVQGNMREIRTMQIDTWVIGYTADTLQIGCQRHAIDKWRAWSSPAGRKWVASMDSRALEWADRNLALVLALIDANPATPTGHEAPASEDENIGG
jgi:hypothetical protein